MEVSHGGNGWVVKCSGVCSDGGVSSYFVVKGQGFLTGVCDMWVLIMIVLLGSQGATLNHLYYEDELSCTKAAATFESHKGKEFKLKAFCIKGDN